MSGRKITCLSSKHHEQPQSWEKSLPIAYASERLQLWLHSFLTCSIPSNSLPSEISSTCHPMQQSPWATLWSNHRRKYCSFQGVGAIHQAASFWLYPLEGLSILAWREILSGQAHLEHHHLQRLYNLSHSLNQGCQRNKLVYIMPLSSFPLHGIWVTHCAKNDKFWSICESLFCHFHSSHSLWAFVEHIWMLILTLLNAIW